MTEVVRDVLFWNVNGLRARWGAKKLPFSQVISAKDPDLVVLTEVRSSFERVWGLSGFEQFHLTVMTVSIAATWRKMQYMVQWLE